LWRSRPWRSTEEEEATFSSKRFFPQNVVREGVGRRVPSSGRHLDPVLDRNPSGKEFLPDRPLPVGLRTLGIGS
jgi:hypothetical protein